MMRDRAIAIYVAALKAILALNGVSVNSGGGYAPTK